MSYRPIVNKFTLTQTQNSNQLNWNDLIISNQIVQLPYDKASGKFQIFGKKNNLNLKEFCQLILFQGYLLDIQEKFQLLPSYSIFQFNNPQGELVNDQDLNIKKLISESNLEVVSKLNNNLLSSKDQLISLFETINQQFTPNVSKIQSKLNNQISSDDIIYTIKQIKLYTQSLVFNLYELNIMINQERQTIKIIQNVLIQNKQFYKEKSLAYQTSIIYIIKELEEKYEQEYIINFKKFPIYLISIFHILSVYQDEVNSTNFIPETSKIRIQKSSNKNQLNENFLKYMNQKKFIYFYKRISQRFQSQILINIYNFNFIQQLGGEFVEYYNKCFIQQKELSQIDLRQHRIVSKQIIMILKLVKQLLAIEQRKIVSLNTYKDNENSRVNTQQQDQIKDQQQLKEEQYYKNYMINLGFRYKLIFIKQILIKLQHHQNEGIDLIHKQNWSEVFKSKHILKFKEIKNKLQILELLKHHQQSFIIEIISLFNKQLEEISQEEQQQQELVQIELLNITNNNMQQLKKQFNIQDCITSENLFNWDSSISEIQQLIQNFKKINNIIQQRNENIQLTQVQFQKPMIELVDDTFNSNYFEIYSDLKIELINFLSKMAESKQIIFNENFLRQLSEEPCLDQKTTIQIISEGSSFYIRRFIIDKAYTFMLQNLKIENNVQEDGFLVESSYKVREATVFNLIKMQSFLHEPVIQEFCQSLLKQIWTIEKHDSVKSILKKKEMIEMQKKLFSQDLATFSNKLKIEMQKRLKSIEQLETQVLISDNQAIMKNQLQQAYEEFENYLDNATDMSQRMDISLIFLREISKDLKSIKSSIDIVLSSVKGIEDDVRRLSGKNYLQLLQIRKEKILKQKQETELDQVHIQITTQEYDPVTGKKKESINRVLTSYLLKQNIIIFMEKLMNFCGVKVKGKKMFCFQKEKQARQKPKTQFIRISLRITELQFRQDLNQRIKEAVFNGNLKIILILESYDEMKFDCIQSNLYQTNRLAQDLNLQISGQNVKLIITTREEILTSIRYQTWFYGKNIETLKEVEILPFTQEQSLEYIRLYCEVSVKRAIKRFYEFFKQLRGQTISTNEFKVIWSTLEENINIIINQKQNQDFLFNPQDVDKIIIKLQAIEFFNHIRTDQMISLKKELTKLWGQQKFTQVIKNVNINHFMSTPFMMELIVYVLPKMTLIFSEPNYLRDTLKKQYQSQKKKPICNIYQEIIIRINKNKYKIRMYFMKQSSFHKNRLSLKILQNNFKQQKMNQIIKIFLKIFQWIIKQNFWVLLKQFQDKCLIQLKMQILLLEHLNLTNLLHMTFMKHLYHFTIFNNFKIRKTQGKIQL
ncbi:unnamed protein product [Paramecium sonneborni]|uniref:Uncharacterized protein n=1 Tax=Paramecium sonneborni TaxID=65129 RepID=A0A8S1RPA3_9CILI|nr:unnamed protein product [Paramecium sonneborni]